MVEIDEKSEDDQSVGLIVLGGHECLYKITCREKEKFEKRSEIKTKS